MFVQDGFLYLIVTRHKLTVHGIWMKRLDYMFHGRILPANTVFPDTDCQW